MQSHMIRSPQSHNFLTQEQSMAFARNFAEKQIAPGDILLFEGELGTGKTALIREMIRTLTGNPEEIVPSPTFTLVQNYESDRMDIRHFDLYRLTDESEIFELGWEEALSGPVVFVEWPERLGEMVPKGAARLQIKQGEAGPESRHVEITIT